MEKGPHETAPLVEEDGEQEGNAFMPIDPQKGAESKGTDAEEEKQHVSLKMADHMIQSKSQSKNRNVHIKSST